jgi:hypothetical protein
VSRVGVGHRPVGRIVAPARLIARATMVAGLSGCSSGFRIINCQQGTTKSAS